MQIERQLQEARQRLLDLTLKNRLLNFRPTKRRTIKVIDEIPKEIFDILVLQEKKMQFKPFVKAITTPTNAEEDEENVPLQWLQDTEPVQRHTDRLLQTELPKGELQKRLNYVHQQARSVFEEQGYSILYLALGFLEWNESESTEQAKLSAPLILIPVELERQKVRTRFSLCWSGAELFPNLSLEAKLAGQDVALPALETPETKADIDAYFQAVSKAVSHQDEWRVVSDIYLDFFSFTKFVMYKDLESEAWAIDTHPLLGLILGEGPNASGEDGFKPEEADRRLASQNVYHVMDADSSQIAVIEDIKDGKNLVVEGPPGTGKSQTITNIIAELLAAGKNVLFVSEKMAALEVVKSRVDRVGLGDSCLELHSHKSNKRVVLKELERTLCAPSPNGLRQADIFPRLDSLKATLNGYVNALHEPIRQTRKSPFMLFAIRENSRHYFKNSAREMPQVTFANSTEIDSTAWDTARLSLEELATVLRLVMPIAEHPWHGCATAITALFIEKEIYTLIEKFEDALEVLENVSNRFVAAFRTRVMELRDEYEDFSAKRWWQGIFSWKYHYSVKGQIRKYYGKPLPQEREVILADLKELADCIIIKEGMQWVMASTQTGPSLFEEQWHGGESSPEKFGRFAKWIVKFRKYLHDGILTQTCVDIAGKDIFQGPDDLLRKQLNSAVNDFAKTRDALFKCLGANYNTLFGVMAEKVPFDKLRLQLELWRKERAQLHSWSQFLIRNKACRKTIAHPLLGHIENLKPEDLVPCFEGNLAEALLQEAYADRPPLNSFVRDLHEKRIADFYKLDSDSIELNRRRLGAKLHQNRRPTYLAGTFRESVNKLQGQFNRKRSHMSIRKLLSTAGELIQRIKPCFMMSPLSIAQFCDPQMIHFDVIVFDEASQIRPEDALGALLRGKQAVVIGDTQQLPPTRLFENIVEDTEKEEEDDLTTSIVDVESILHQCRRSFPTKALKWHYRSRHESLIAVSNREFYDNNLLIFPSPIDKATHLGLSFTYLPDAVYDRGQSRTNQKEAEAVVQATFAHYRQYPEKSLGIGTFSIKQQQAILDEVERQLLARPDMEKFFASDRDEHFFVKNLETIQGDERDVIFLSVGYGKTASGRLYQNFGPLNREGGQRRLNVLITRAREQCVVFSNFHAKDLQLAANAAFGIRALKIFLDYAENKNLQIHKPAGSDTESPFEEGIEEGIHKFLESHGYTVNTKIGCADYRIDLAVVDANSPGRYLLGIECDGAQYRNAPVARDRDRLRQQVLKGLGWTLHRVWSMDWYRNQAETGQRLLEAVENAKVVTPEKPSTAPAPQLVQVPPDQPTRKPVPETPPSPETSQNIPDYVVCSDLGIPIQDELHLQPPSQLAKAATKIVEIESPVHINEVILRIRLLWGLKRAGTQIKNAIEEGLASAYQSKHIRRAGDFLWAMDTRETQVRHRLKPKIELICKEEIAEAIKLVLASQGAIMPNALAIETAKLFGYKFASKAVRDRIKTLLNKLIQKEIFQLAANGMVNVTRN